MIKVAGFVCVFFLSMFSYATFGQSDPLQKESNAFRKLSGDRLMLQFEERTRWEEKFGVNFGKDVNQQDMLSRLRIGMQYSPTNWLTVTGLGQDARVSFYGKPAPNSLRDTIDLQEAYLAVSAGDKSGWRASFGRRMLNYGETRVIGTPQWSNVARTYDHGRVGFSASKASLEILMVSPVIVRPDEFNSPELGNRFWGTYNSFSGIWRGTSMDLFALRHSQNKSGGWTDKGTLGTNSFGGRLYGALPDKFVYSLEAVGQTGHLGVQNQRAYAWFAGITRPINVVNMPLSLSGEFKAASGSRYGSDHSATFDQLSPANHDKFGHEDLFGWRNLNTIKSLETLKVSKSVSFSLMYTNHFLFSASDALYNSQGSQIALSKMGLGGKHVGQELDSFVTYRVGAHSFYAGFGHFFKGTFVENETKGINPRYFYIAQQYTIN